MTEIIILLYNLGNKFYFLDTFLDSININHMLQNIYIHNLFISELFMDY